VNEGLYSRNDSQRRRVRDMPTQEQPLYRLQAIGVQAMSSAEILASILQTHDALDLATDMLALFGGVDKLSLATMAELQRFDGVGKANAARIKAALELGRRCMTAGVGERPRVTSPADAANLLMNDMMLLEKEHLVVVCLNTRNEVIHQETVYVGSLNTSVVRIGELFRVAIRANAAAIIVAHNHPSGDASPSPEDVSVTRQIVQSGKLLDIDLLDHIIIGRQQYVSLKERGLGFS